MTLGDAVQSRACTGSATPPVRHGPEALAQLMLLRSSLPIISSVLPIDKPFVFCYF